MPRRLSGACVTADDRVVCLKLGPCSKGEKKVQCVITQTLYLELNHDVL